MRKILISITILTLLVSAVMVQAVQAAPRQIVVIVADGLSPQIVDFGTVYVKTAYEAGTNVAFDELKGQGKVTPAGALSMDALKGVLQTAGANGYKTGLVTTADVTTVAPLFYGMTAGNNADAARAIINDAKFDFLAGGGRGYFTPQGTVGSLRTDATDFTKSFRDAGGQTLFNIEAMDEEVKGRALALQSDNELTYAIDRDVEKEAGFAELVTLALQTLSADDAPFMLVVHDTLLAKSLAARDTPAWMEQYRELDGIVADVLGMREEKPADMGVAVVATGSTVVPRFSTELPNERSDAFFIVSALPMSYAKAGASLANPSEAKLTAFAAEQYKGWKLSAENRAAMLAGTMTPEAAIRASYEPALKINYETTTSQPTVYSVGLDVGGDLAQALNQMAMMKPASKPATPAP